MKRLSLTSWIFIGMAIGISLGFAFPAIMKSATPDQSPVVLVIARVFLRLIKSIIAPLIFATLVAGIAGAGSVKAMGRIGLKAILYFEAATTIALFVGLGAVNIVQPGVGVKLETETKAKPVEAMTFEKTMNHTFPQSVIEAMAQGEVLQIVVFAFLFGTACAAIGVKARPVVDLCQSLADVMFRYTKYVMYLAPIGVGAAMAYTVGNYGIPVLFGLIKLVLALYGALLLFVFVVFGISVAIARVPLRAFLKAVREPTIIGFSTTSSEAALPLALENMVRFGIPKHIVGFVLPMGYSLNLTGSTLYQALAAIFVAQAAGMHLSLGTQLLLMLTLMLTSKGAAGVTGSSIVVLAGTISMFGLPAVGISVLMGADRLLDMARTAVNVLGNCVATAVVARWEGVDLSAAENRQFQVEAL
jgi:proton glutamate symport protein